MTIAKFLLCGFICSALFSFEVLASNERGSVSSPPATAINSRNYSVSLNFGRTTVKDVASGIQTQTGLVFSYSNTTGNTEIPGVKANLKNVSATKLLETVFKSSGIVWSINDRMISLSKPEASAISPEARKLIGTVTDAVTGEPLVGVGVYHKDKPSMGVITDLDGKYEIEVTEQTELEFYSLGYKTQSLLVSDLGVMNVELYPENETIDEVVVVGAGTQRKVSVTGAISAVKGDELKAPASSLTNNLAGKLAGVISVTSSGEPGSTSQFYIRGISTFGGRTTPLILLDGVEISANDLNNLPAESIEGFSILKDASATAIYGARGANGVMLITTKSGTENTKARINVTVDCSILQPVNIVEYADGATYMSTYNEALLARNPLAEKRYSDKVIAHTKSGASPYLFPDVDWYDLMFKNFTSNQKANINIQGGGSKVTYYMSLQANHDSGLLDVPNEYSFNNNHNRWSYIFQNNIAYKVTPTTKIDLRMNAQIVSQTSPNVTSDNIFRQVFFNNPVTFPAIFPKENGVNHLRFGSAIMSPGKYYTNPYANMLNTYKKTNENKLNISLNIDQKLDFITEGLSVTALVNFNNWSHKFYIRSLSPFLYGIKSGSWTEDDPNTYEITQFRKGEEFITQSDITRDSDNTFYFDARLNYKRTFGDGHNVTGMLMYMMREYSRYALPQRNQGFSGRATYDYKNRYLVEFNFGYNGTERLGQNDRFEFFPAMSIGWVISNENFWDSIRETIDFFKIRSSFGLVGSDETGLEAGAQHFMYLDFVNMTGGPTFGSGFTGNTTHTGPIVTSYAVEDPCWERSTQFDIGIDLHLFNQLNLTVDYYNYMRSRILMKRASFPAILGYGSTTPWANIGKVHNQGIEIGLNWNKQLAKDLWIDLRGNFTYTRNKYIYLDEPDYPYIWQTKTGKSLSAIYGYLAEGLFESEEEIRNSADQSIFGSTIMPGDIRYRDVDGNGRITEEDQVMLSPYGNIPRIQYGFGISMTWKKLDFSVFFNGSAQRDLMLNNAAIYPFCANDSNDHNLMQWIADSHWSEGKDNSNVEYPRLGTLDTQISNNQQPSSWWLRKGGFLRFKTLEIGYSFPHCRVYLNGDNIAVWSPFKYWDPELQFYSYPLQRTFNIGVQINF